MGNFLGKMMIYSGGIPLMATVLIFIHPKIVLGLGTGGFPVPLLHFVQKTCRCQLL